ncbi:MAG: pyridoxamine 5'-phosphate oxidase [Campylobacteraceae bacterium]|nr:pyridoxamine 5'-phosphate oxidase [Campylobacteraceae bacterium]
MKLDLSKMRQEYTTSTLDEKDLNSDPFKEFTSWFEKASGQLEPNAMSLATVDPLGSPSLRTVLLKFFDKEGFVFFSNYESKKAKDLEENPNAALLFTWLSLERQIQIRGVVQKISRKESLKYFLSRPKGSQLGAWVSKQSSIISSRSLLEQQISKLKTKFAEGKIPLPDFWGGYKLYPESFEFWQGGQNRLHDRFLYTKSSKEWEIKRLAP